MAKGSKKVNKAPRLILPKSLKENYQSSKHGGVVYVGEFLNLAGNPRYTDIRGDVRFSKYFIKTRHSKGYKVQLNPLGIKAYNLLEEEREKLWSVKLNNLWLVLDGKLQNNPKRKGSYRSHLRVELLNQGLKVRNKDSLLQKIFEPIDSELIEISREAANF